MSVLTIGIDLGTTKTTASRYNEVTGKVDLIPLGKNGYMLTSVCILPDGTWLIGDEADVAGQSYAKRYYREFLNKLGGWSHQVEPWDADPSKGSVKGFFKELFDEDGPTCQVTDLVRAVLEYIRQKTEDTLCLGIRRKMRALITTPVFFDEAQQDELRQVALEAGFLEVKFTTTIDAAAQAFAQQVLANQSVEVLLMDWGGDGLNWGVATNEANKVDTHRDHMGGVNGMGGERINLALMGYVIDRVKSLGGENLTGEKARVRNSIFHAVCQAQEALSRLPQVELTLKSKQEHNPVPSVIITQAEWAEILQRNLSKVDNDLNYISYYCQNLPVKPTMLLLTGGLCASPLVAQCLSGKMQLPQRYWKEAVSWGAALLARAWGNDAAPPPVVTEHEFPEEVFDVYLTTQEMTEGCEKTFSSSPYHVSVEIGGGLVPGIVKQYGKVRVRILSADPIEVNGRTSDGIPVLIHAAENNQTELAHWLIEQGADVNIASANGGTALMAAAGQDNLEIAKKLLQLGANVNARDLRGMTALMKAAERGKTDMVNLLLGNGADVHMRLVDGTTAIQVALKNGHAELAYSLQARESQH